MCAQILLIEPFYGGSHKQLIDLITKDIGDYALFTLPAKKWHWRARVSAMYFSQVIPPSVNYRCLFCSSVLNLTELVALRPDLGKIWKVVYFHENQLVYPVRKYQERDFQYGYNQILTCLVADEVIFNSEYNRHSFLQSIQSFLKLIPDFKLKSLAEKIHPKTKVLFFPIELSPLKLPLKGGINKQLVGEENPLCKIHASGKIKDTEQTLNTDFCDESLKHPTEVDRARSNPADTSLGVHSVLCPSYACGQTQQDNQDSFSASVLDIQLEKHDLTEPELNSDFLHCQESDTKPLHIVWAHRWEHDKDPENFFKALFKLHDDGLKFVVSVMGESFQQIPDIFLEAKDKLSTHLYAWGYQDNKGEYYNILEEADVAVSTALHEFFGVAMLEAVHMGCYPLCPKRLVYPEIFPEECLYNTHQQLYQRLRTYCRHPHLVRTAAVKNQLDLERFSWKNLGPKYRELLLQDRLTA